MMNTENAYFAEMKKIGGEWQEAKKEREARGNEIIADFGYDSEEYKAWKTEDDVARFPYESGASKAFWEWRRSIERKVETFEVSEFLWDKEVADFAATLKLAGIESFIYTNRSTAAMDNILGFVAAGCKLVGPSEVVRKSKWEDEADETVTGILFELR